MTRVTGFLGGVIGLLIVGCGSEGGPVIAPATSAATQAVATIASTPVSTPTVVVTSTAVATRAPTPTPAPVPISTPTPGPAYNGMNLASAISTADSAGETPHDVGGGVLGIIDPSDWTVCFSTIDGNSVTFYAAKGCTPDANSQSGSTPSTTTVSALIGQNLQNAESSLRAAGSGYQEIGGGLLGIIVPADWTVCYATVASGAAQLFAAKDCSSASAG